MAGINVNNCSKPMRMFVEMVSNGGPKELKLMYPNKTEVSFKALTHPYVLDFPWINCIYKTVKVGDKTIESKFTYNMYDTLERVGYSIIDRSPKVSLVDSHQMPKQLCKSMPNKNGIINSIIVFLQKIGLKNNA